MENQVLHLLAHYELRATEVRTQILFLFVKKKIALSHADIEKGMKNYIDRVTLYRTLKTFVDKGLIHKVLDDEGVIRYALCDTNCTPHHHHHEHIHFKCTVCQTTTCLNEVEVPFIRLPQGYHSSEINMLIQGTCSKCN